MFINGIVIDRRAEAEAPSSTPSSPPSHSSTPGVVIEVLISIGGALLLIGLLGAVFFFVSRYRRRRAPAGCSQTGSGVVKAELPHHLGHDRWVSEATFSVPFLDREKRRISDESMKQSAKSSEENTQEGYLEQGYLSISLEDPEAVPDYAIPLFHNTQKPLPWRPLSPEKESTPQSMATIRETSTSTQTVSACHSKDSESMYSQSSVDSTPTVTLSTIQSFPVPPLSPAPLPHITFSFPAPADIPPRHLHHSENRPIERSDTVVISRLLKARMSHPNASLTRSETKVSHIERAGSIKTVLYDEHRRWV